MAAFAQRPRDPPPPDLGSRFCRNCLAQLGRALEIRPQLRQASVRYATHVLALEPGPALLLALEVSAPVALELAAVHSTCAARGILLCLAVLRRIARRAPRKGCRCISLSCLPPKA